MNSLHAIPPSVVSITPIKMIIFKREQKLEIKFFVQRRLTIREYTKYIVNFLSTLSQSTLSSNNFLSISLKFHLNI